MFNKTLQERGLAIPRFLDKLLLFSNPCIQFRVGSSLGSEFRVGSSLGSEFRVESVIGSMYCLLLLTVRSD